MAGNPRLPAVYGAQRGDFRHPKQSRALLACVEAQDWEGAAGLPKGGTTDDQHCCDLILLRCGTCDWATLEVRLRKKKAAEQRLFYAEVAPEVAEQARRASRKAA